MTPLPELISALDRCRQAAEGQPALAEAVAAVAAHSLALCHQLEALRRERDEFAGFALAGQAMIGLAHELNNLLNGVVLQASVMQLQADPKFHAALDGIRRQANQATGLLRPLGQLSALRAKTFYPVDLGRVVEDVLREQPALAGRVIYSPAATPLPPVRAVSAALKQLVRLVLSGASAWATPPVRVGTEKQGDGVQLVIEIAAPPPRDGEDSPPVNADAVLWNHLNDLERLAAQSLLRQLEGALRMEVRPSGCSVRVRWNTRPAD